ncbi:2-C-methyl-D-erythritol 4-phosphate cytidylyltransferase [Algoriphagus sp. H41]|uniref:2-C-methyl-D-erythritol 4-phosphate cytidylyltransferase n=1 Tax=Algoriphagus oliviformis TaxID=2811231 RepID=A0ABS3C3Q7_9BACT|nr:2-C-methyl-D-erythritol 4-phosphate cytidylyltransferase [Algoriphagus oliviformis]MBN7811716.1 2-C-methyl-D-erythritol 4-phosphate cytidylyltransferase [Algoriphagus oliviformis]
MRKAAILVAGGKGTRMGGSVSKQYLPIGGKPVLMHTLQAFAEAEPGILLVLVLPGGDFSFWKKLCEECQFSLPHELVAGGESRFQSVRNGLAKLPLATELVAIHDGVRPFVSKEVIQTSFWEAEKSGSAIPVVALKDSLRKVDVDGRSAFQDRSGFRLVQTPQTFQVGKIKEAFLVEELAQFTDDATVYEYQGWGVTLIEGNIENIKITTREDLEYAEFLLSRR